MSFAQNVKDISFLFSLSLNEVLASSELKEIRKNSINSPSCATHDYCDSNMNMLEAFIQTMGFEPDMQNKEHLILIEKAWFLSRLNKFKV